MNAGTTAPQAEVARRGSTPLLDSARAAAVPFVVARLVVIAALVLARSLVDKGVVTGAMAEGASRSGLTSWDASFYERIAELGYAGVGRSSLRFFPLFPLLGRALGAVPGLSDRSSLVVVANVSAFAALIVVQALGRREGFEERTRRTTVWILSLWPGAFVLVMGYAEAVLLLLTIVAFWCWRSGRWWWAAVPALLAGLCRPTGVLLAIPIAVDAALAWRAESVHRAGETASRCCAALAAPFGTLAYLLWTWQRFGSFTRPFTEQLTPARRGGFTDPLVTFLHDGEDVVRWQHLAVATQLPCALLLLALCVYAFFRLPFSYACYGATFMVVALTAANLASLERYALDCFPLLLALAFFCSDRARTAAVLGCSTALLALLSALVFVGVYVP